MKLVLEDGTEHGRRRASARRARSAGEVVFNTGMTRLRRDAHRPLVRGADPRPHVPARRQLRRARAPRSRRHRRALRVGPDPGAGPRRPDTTSTRYSHHAGDPLARRVARGARASRPSPASTPARSPASSASTARCRAGSSRRRWTLERGEAQAARRRHADRGLPPRRAERAHPPTGGGEPHASCSSTRARRTTSSARSSSAA